MLICLALIQGCSSWPPAGRSSGSVESAPALEESIVQSYRDVTLKINGLVSYRQLYAILDFLEHEAEATKEVRLRSFDLGVANAVLKYRGDIHELARTIVNKDFVEFRLEPSRVTGGGMDLVVHQIRW